MPLPKGECRGCGQLRALRLDGCVKVHYRGFKRGGRWGRRKFECPGSNLFPVVSSPATPQCSFPECVARAEVSLLREDFGFCHEHLEAVTRAVCTCAREPIDGIVPER